MRDPKNLDDMMVRLTGEDGKEELFYIIEKTVINGTEYYLLSKSLENGSDAYIAKEVSENEYMSVLEFVDDDKEVDYIGKIFTELLAGDDIDLESE